VREGAIGLLRSQKRTALTTAAGTTHPLDGLVNGAINLAIVGHLTLAPNLVHQQAQSHVWGDYLFQEPRLIFHRQRFDALGKFIDFGEIGSHAVIIPLLRKRSDQSESAPESAIC
jgi:hypothetical protein